MQSNDDFTYKIGEKLQIVLTNIKTFRNFIRLFINILSADKRFTHTVRFFYVNIELIEADQS